MPHRAKTQVPLELRDPPFSVQGGPRASTVPHSFACKLFQLVRPPGAEGKRSPRATVTEGPFSEANKPEKPQASKSLEVQALRDTQWRDFYCPKTHLTCLALITTRHCYRYILAYSYGQISVRFILSIYSISVHMWNIHKPPCICVNTGFKTCLCTCTYTASYTSLRTELCVQLASF